MLLFQLLQTRVPASTHKLLCMLVNVPTGSIQDKSFLGTGCLGLPVWHSGGASRSYRSWRWLSNHRQTSISRAPQRISDCVLQRRYRIVTRKGAAIYEFHGESEFESESFTWKGLIFGFFAKKNCVKICWTEEVYTSMYYIGNLIKYRGYCTSYYFYYY